MNISLTVALEELVKKKVASGLYNNASEVMREALRLMELRDRRDAAKLNRLKTEAAVGFEALDRGEISKNNLEQIADKVLKRHKGKARS
jgi:antitoxin ParD1/3/4